MVEELGKKGGFLNKIDWNYKYESFINFLPPDLNEEYYSIRKNVYKGKIKNVIPNILPYFSIIGIVIYIILYLLDSLFLWLFVTLALTLVSYLWTSRIYRKSWILLIGKRNKNFLEILNQQSMISKMKFNIDKYILDFIEQVNPELIEYDKQ